MFVFRGQEKDVKEYQLMVCAKMSNSNMKQNSKVYKKMFEIWQKFQAKIQSHMYVKIICHLKPLSPKT